MGWFVQLWGGLTQLPGSATEPRFHLSIDINQIQDALPR